MRALRKQVSNQRGAMSTNHPSSFIPRHALGKATSDFYTWLYYQCWRSDAVGDLARAQHYGTPWPDYWIDQDTADLAFAQALREYQAFLDGPTYNPQPTITTREEEEATTYEAQFLQGEANYFGENRKMDTN